MEDMTTKCPTSGHRFGPAVVGFFVSLAFVTAAGVTLAYAQENGGPTPDEIAQFEREFVPPADQGPSEPQIERPQFEEPGQVPAEVRSQVN